MEIWLDTASLSAVSQAAQMRILHGVTTNPSIAAHSELPFEELLKQLLQAQKGPVTAQVIGETSQQMIEEGKALHRFSNRIMIKVPVTAEGLKAIAALSEHQIPVMATAIFEPNQILMAARAGAQYVAPYFSRICEQDLNGLDIFKSMHQIVQSYQFPTKLIAASLRSPDQVRECMELGVEAVTLNEKVFAKMIENHPLTDEAVQRFSKDWKGANRAFPS